MFLLFPLKTGADIHSTAGPTIFMNPLDILHLPDYTFLGQRVGPFGVGGDSLLSSAAVAGFMATARRGTVSDV